MLPKISALIALAFCVVSAFSIADAGGQSTSDFELLPHGRLFRPTFADPREIRMGIDFQGSRVDAAVGNYFSLVGWNPKGSEWKFDSGIEGAGYFTMREAYHRFPLETADGLIGLYTEGKYENWETQFRYTHISAHLADGSAEQAIAYSREFMALREAYVPSNDLQIYTGLYYIVNSTPIVNPWAFQFGSSFFVPFDHTKLVPFTAFDLKWQGETSYNPSFNLEVGIALNNPPEAYRSFRIFYNYYTGADPRGQFYNRIYTAHAIGLEMQI